MITIVSSNVCPYCSMAKELIKSLGGEYKEVQVDMGSDELREIINTTGMMTVPQIFDGEIAKENLLGGYSEISALHSEGKLEPIINK